MAMFDVGLAYLHGRGISQDVEEGLRWCGSAAEAGWRSAAVLLSSVYGAGGFGIPADKDKAAYWKGVVGRGWGAAATK